MANDGALQSSLVWLAAIMVVVGLYTQSLKKMLGTYLFGVLGIAGVLLPDWEFFNRHVSQWCSPVCVYDAPPHAAHTPPTPPQPTPPPPPPPSRFGIYPVRLALYTVVYGVALYKWWMFVSH